PARAFLQAGFRPPVPGGVACLYSPSALSIGTSNGPAAFDIAISALTSDSPAIAPDAAGMMNCSPDFLLLLSHMAEMTAPRKNPCLSEKPITHDNPSPRADGIYLRAFGKVCSRVANTIPKIPPMSMPQRAVTGT